jgi:prolyl-tRNA editing enzyme YbaK/EbsC (Cys-tRNA(Pro) deacylase)
VGGPPSTRLCPPGAVAPSSVVSVDGDAAIEERVRARLRESGDEYTEIACDPDFADTAAFCERYGYPLSMSANTIVVAARKEPGVACACVVLATDRLDVNHTVCSLLGVRKASFAPADMTRELTGMLIGGVTPFGLPPALPLYIDSRVMDQEQVIIGGGSRSLKLQIAPAALAALPGATVVSGLAMVPPGEAPLDAAPR